MNFDPLDTLDPVWTSDPVVRSQGLNQGKIAWWLALPGLDGGRQWFDLMGLNHGTLTNMTTSASGWGGTTRAGGSGHILFDGSDDSVQCGTAAALNPPAVTLACWIRADSLAHSYNATLARSVGTFALEQMFVKSSGKLAMYVLAASSINYDGTGTTTLATGTWYRLVLTYDSVAGLKGYVNGVLDGSAAANGPLIAASATFAIGSDLVNAGRNFAGAIDDVAVWNRALTAAEVPEDYKLSRLGYPGVLRRWPGVGAAMMAPTAGFPAYLNWIEDY